jgi:hypothetical protein
MNVLVDTSVWSLALRRKTASLNTTEKFIVAELSELVREGRVDCLHWEGATVTLRTRIWNWPVALFSLLWIAKRLLRFYREEFEVRETVSTVKSMAKKIQIEFTT